MTIKTASVLIGLAFLAVGILGFFPNPIVYDSDDAIFHADTLHNGVHIASGVLFLIIALAVPTAIRGFTRVFGGVYLLLGILGVVNFGTSGMGKLFGILHVNGADNLLHIGLGLVIFLASFLRSNDSMTS